MEDNYIFKHPICLHEGPIDAIIKTDFSKLLRKVGVDIIRLLNKIDIILVISISLLAIVIATILWVQPFEGQLYACVYIDGEYIESIPLQEELKEIEIKTQYGTNILMLLDNKVYIKESDCSYQQCVNAGLIDRPKQSISCAPHGLVITIEDAKSVEGK